MEKYEQEQLLAKARILVEQRLGHDSSGHDSQHIFRVVKLALHIASLVEEEVNLFLLEMVCLLHDLDDPKITRQDAKIVDNFFQENGVVLYYQVMIKDMIDRLSYSSTKMGIRQEMIEGKIAQDADRLDAIGAVGIARAFAYGGSKNRKIDGEEADVTLRHFDDKLLKLKDLLNLEQSKKIAENRHEFMVAFLKQYDDEINIKK